MPAPGRSGPGRVPHADGLLADTLADPARSAHLRTDRCNFRCSYCMPKQVFDKHHEFLPHAELLSFEEITVARAFVAQGSRRSASPVASPCCAATRERLIAQLAALRTPDGRLLDSRSPPMARCWHARRSC